MFRKRLNFRPLTKSFHTMLVTIALVTTPAAVGISVVQAGTADVVAEETLYHVVVKPKEIKATLKNTEECPSELSASFVPVISLSGSKLRVEIKSETSINMLRSGVACSVAQLMALAEAVRPVKQVVLEGPSFLARSEEAYAEFVLPSPVTDLSGWKLQIEVTYFDVSESHTVILGELRKSPWAEVRITVVDASGEKVNVPLMVMDATGAMTWKGASFEASKASLHLAPGEYVVTVTEGVAKEVRVFAGETKTVELGRRMIALPLESTVPNRSWIPFELAEPDSPHLDGVPPGIDDPSSMLNLAELEGIDPKQNTRDLIKRAIDAAIEILNSKDPQWYPQYEAVKTLAELGPPESRDPLIKIFEKSESVGEKTLAAQGLVRLLGDSELHSLFRSALKNGSPTTKLATAQVAVAYDLIDSQEILLAIEPFATVKDLRWYTLNLLGSMNLPLKTIQDLAKKIRVYESPEDAELAVLFNLARHGDERAFGVLRQLAFDQSPNGRALGILIRLVKNPVPIVKSKLVLKKQPSIEEQRTNLQILNSLEQVNWGKYQDAIKEIMDLAKIALHFDLLQTLTHITLEQYYITGPFRLATLTAVNGEVGLNMARELARLGVGSHLILLEDRLTDSIDDFTLRGEYSWLAGGLAKDIGKVIPSGHTKDSKEARAVLEHYLEEEQDPFVRLIAARGLLVGIQEKERMLKDRGWEQSHIFYDYKWSDGKRPGKDKVSEFFAVFIAPQPSAALKENKIELKLDLIVDYDCEGGMLAFGCIELGGLMKDEAKKLIEQLSLIEPSGKQHRLGREGLAFSFQMSQVPKSWDGWILELKTRIKGTYVGDHQKVFLFDIAQLLPT